MIVLPMKPEQFVLKEKYKIYKMLEELTVLKVLHVHLEKLFVKIMFVKLNVQVAQTKISLNKKHSISKPTYVTKHSPLYVLEENVL